LIASGALNESEDDSDDEEESKPSAGIEVHSATVKGGVSMKKLDGVDEEKLASQFNTMMVNGTASDSTMKSGKMIYD
jgi:hypothetical protein